VNTNLIFSIAKALLLARWKQTLVAAVGVTFSITMFIALLSFMGGLNAMLDNLVLYRTAHIRLFNDIKPSKNQPINLSGDFSKSYSFISSVKTSGVRQQIYNSLAIMAQLDKDPRVEGHSPKLTSQVFYNNGNNDITGVIFGVDVEAESRLYHFKDYVVAGTGSDIGKVSNSILLGKGLADLLLVDIGDVVQITTSRGVHFPLKVVGYFQSGIREYDKVQSYASIATVQKLLGEPGNYITDIQVKLHDMGAAPAIAKEYAELFSIDAEDIQTANAQFETGSSIRTLISYAVGITLLIVAGFGIYNILNMMIYEKMETIAILKATGFAGKDVKRIFLSIAITIGIVGGGFGLLFGLLASIGIAHIPFTNSSIPTVNTYPVSFLPMYYIIGITFSLITTYLAGWFPARKASKIDPVVIIRGK
jgi:lipoprotein-releasing system permease protein